MKMDGQELTSDKFSYSILHYGECIFDTAVNGIWTEYTFMNNFHQK